MTKKIIVNGARGKMGSITCETLRAHPEFELVAELGREDNLKAAISDTKAEIVVELTRVDCVYQNSLTIIKAGAHPVIGASGLKTEEQQHLKNLCEEKRLGGIIIPNFSIAAVLMMQFAKKAAAYFPEVEIIEMHHQQKADAPSSTAIKTAEMIAESRNKPKNKLSLKEVIPGARGSLHQEINIHSLRLPGVLARQEVLFGSLGETLSITHDTNDRKCFMGGLILACQQVMKLNSLYYGLEHLLER